MSPKIQIPKWLSISDVDLRKIDLGIRIKPLTNSDLRSGVIMRGPIVLAAHPNTPDVRKSLLPRIMTNVRFINEGSSYMIEYTGSPYRITELDIKPRVIPMLNGIRIETTDGIPYMLRKLLRGDLQLFRFGPGSAEEEVMPFLRSFWGVDE